MTTMDGAASSTPSRLAFDDIGPCQFTPPDKFVGKKEKSEEFAFQVEIIFTSDASRICERLQRD